MFKNTYITLLAHISLVILFTISTPQYGKSQLIEHCGTMEKHTVMLENDPVYKQYRKELEHKISKLKNGASNREQDINGIITIPVVFHVVHDGDTIGSNALGEDNENLPDFILEDQLQQINEDFRRTSGYPSYTPQAFLDIAADVEVDFCLASIDENGDYTTGIIRHDIVDLPDVSMDSTWTGTFIDTYIKQNTIWDNTKYLNIWVVKKIESINNGVVSNTVLGYAQFPGGPELEDGIVLRSTIVGGPDHTNYTYGHPIFIASPLPNPLGYRRGRTGTHEVGHYLNLYHIWGDGDCSETDLVDDTPNAEESTSSLNDCETFNDTCIDSPINHPDMHQNHMDYGNGDCKTIFTTGQKTRMLDAIMLSRPGLITSSCQPTPINDLISSPGYIDCEALNDSWNTFNATSSDSPDACEVPITNAGVWFEFSGEDNEVDISFCYSDYYPSLNVYKFVNGDLTCVPSTIDDCTATGNPTISFSAFGSSSYYIYASASSSNFNNSSLRLTVTCEDIVCPQSSKFYVDDDSNGDGSSWTNALSDLQVALDLALECGIDTILIAEGTYYPASSPDDISTDPRDRAFHLNTDVVIMGGYDPSTNTQTGAETILSGDIGVLGDATDNTFHVMVNTGLTPLANFQNLTFSDGNANGSPSNDISFGGTTFDRQYGGGIYNKSSQPTYSNCVFTNNQATLNGGGLYLTSSDATIIDCDFTSNTAANGGGIGNAYSSSSTISNSTFKSNIATSTGGGVANIFSAQTVITNCVLVENEADNGGGIANNGATIDIINCSLTANSTTNSAALFASTTTNISNTILWGNGNEIVGTVMINNSIIKDGYTGCNDCPNVNGDIDPLFVNAADPDGLDNILGTSDDGILIEAGSPAINSGNPSDAPSDDISGTSRIGIVDIGAYEGLCQSDQVYVNFNAVGNGNGLSWTDAFTDLQVALDQAMTCGINTILIAEGTYYPTSSPDDISTDPRDRAFHFNTDVVIMGGYDPSTNTQTGGETILSGDIGVLGDATDNTYHVMVNTGLTPLANFQNLTFSDGNANGASTNDLSFGGATFDRQYGGGIYNKSSQPTYSNCVFTNNQASLYGGGLYITSSIAIVNDCLFESNTATNGGGVGHAYSSSSQISNSIFKSNIAISSGGGIANVFSSETTLTNCLFIDNIAQNGCGITNSGTSIDINNCTITENSVPTSVAAISSSTSTNISNTILWGNGNEISGVVTINNSIVEGGYTGCIDCPNTDGDSDPLFIDALDIDGPDNILGTSDDGISIGAGSPAINTGNPSGAPSDDISGASRIGIVDIGAYEGLCQSKKLYVNKNAVGNGSGLNWTDAFTDLQVALDQISICSVDSIFVAAGTYYPTSSPDEISTDPRDRAFHLNTDVVVMGGFDPSTNTQTGGETVLDGDIGTIGDSLDNSYHVMVTTGLTSATVLEALTFTNGNANSLSSSSILYGGSLFNRRNGGGISCMSSQQTYVNCVFSLNIAASYGGGVSNYSSSPLLTNCIFTSNSASYGGGLQNSLSSSPTLTNCTFESNLANNSGGGIENYEQCSPIVIDCHFTENSATNRGGGINNERTSSPTLTNCTFESNLANSGGGINNSSNSSPTLNNCTLESNLANDSGGGINNSSNSSPTLNNCTLESNSAINLGGGMNNVGESSPTLTNCIFESNNSTSSTGAGGGMYSINSSPILTSCIFISNASNNLGGAIRNNSNDPILTDCIFISNTASNGGGGMANNNSLVSLTDCSFYVPASNEGILNEANSTTTINGTVEVINNYVTDIEGNAYKTIQIGNQNWMAENLNIGAMIDGIDNQTDNDTIEKYCYDNNPDNCDIYGGLYQWNEMMQYVTTEGTQGVCPSGWHLPSDDEFKTLEMALGMTQAEADMTGNRGTDQGSQLAGNESLWTNGALDQSAAFGSSGFVVLPSGKRTSSNGMFNSIGNETSLWSSTELNTASAWYRTLERLNKKVNRTFYVKGKGLSVRCVQD